MTQNLSLAYTHAAALFQVEYLGQKDVPAALALIEDIRTSDTLQQHYHLKPRTADELNQSIKDGFPLFGIKNGEGQLVAFTSISSVEGEDRQYIIRSLCAAPSYKGQGFANKLLAAALNWTTQNGGGLLTARVAETNATSYGLFTKYGFQSTQLLWDDKERYWVHIMARSCADNHNCTIGNPAFQLVS